MSLPRFDGNNDKLWKEKSKNPWTKCIMNCSQFHHYSVICSLNAKEIENLNVIYRWAEAEEAFSFLINWTKIEHKNEMVAETM